MKSDPGVVRKSSRVVDAGLRYDLTAATESISKRSGYLDGSEARQTLKDQVMGFMKSWREMLMGAFSKRRFGVYGVAHSKAWGIVHKDGEFRFMIYLFAVCLPFGRYSSCYLSFEFVGSFVGKRIMDFDVPASLCPELSYYI
ncbi:hypothetical protein Bca52824_024513 [Brassica carinata]|uniref:Uncharacterized protein n=1 Tax=Brassica carinata TaxID=52824 RepID=A0A8X7VKJ5_BRACI|nr:hypothetical protein Bca52824_024513 [Brassica carinata]